LPNRLPTTFQVAECVGCHEETIRRANLGGLLVSQRFGVRRRRFHPDDVLEPVEVLDLCSTIAIQVARALDKAHRAGITHRDLKAANVAS